MRKITKKNVTEKKFKKINAIRFFFYAFSVLCG